MAKTTDSKNGKVAYTEWVWCIDNLSKTQLSAHDKKPFSADDILGKFQELEELGFKITIKRDTYNNCIQVNAVCDETTYENAGLALSSRSDDLHDACSILCYKFFVVAQSDLRGFAESVPKGVRG